MNDLAGLAEAVARCSSPVALWLGEVDLYYAASVEFAAGQRITLIALPGDHLSVLEKHGVEAAERVSNFIQRAIP